VSKRNKRKPAQDSAAHALGELEREGDRLADWLTANQTLILAAAGGVLAHAALRGFISSSREASRTEAATALAELQAEYRVAMGAAPGAFEIAEPANPETAREVRADFVTRFSELATEHRGDTVGALASLEEASIEQALGDEAAALETLDAELAAQPDDAEIRDYLHSRRAALLELDGRFGDAAQDWAAAASERNPLRADFLANAARCWAEAGDTAQALAVWSELEALDEDSRVPPYVRARMEELAAGA
jgi:hypothetical protein